VNLNQFKLLRVVGKGAFGKVRIVERKDTGLTFALKYVLKEEVIKSESVRNILRERRMLEQLNHPFLCNLRYSFQDIEYIYLVVDLMTGGDLRFHISRRTFTEETIRFWTAELACALQYCHSKGIIHRDVKPDNVLLDAEGHVHLADFNVASDYKPGKKLTSKSGTMAYLAPEVYAGKGYLTEVDWWSLGVVLYECIYSRVWDLPKLTLQEQRPFDGKTSEQLAENIKRAKPKYYVTNPAVSIPCLHAMSALLEKDVSKRIGASSWQSFTQHPFFAVIDFDQLERKEIEPPFRPAADKTNFDASYDLEELLLDEAPLEARARRQRPRAALKEDASAKEVREDELHKALENLFEPFDYTTKEFDDVTAVSPVAVDRADSRRNGRTTTPVSAGRLAPASATLHTPPHERGLVGLEDDLAVRPLDQWPGDCGARNLSRSNSRYTQQHFPRRSFEMQVRSTRSGSGQSQWDSTERADRPIPRSTMPLPSFSQQPQSSSAADSVQSQGSGSSGTAATAAATAAPAAQRNGHGPRKLASKAGGVQLILDETGSWSGLGDANGTPAGSDTEGQGTGRGSGNGTMAGASSGVLSFFSRKKGRARDRSPRPQVPGVLGKEGARVIIS
ncbi:hypothetical protein KEM52_000428, partial [Ascosphaera acerosa]